MTEIDEASGCLVAEALIGSGDQGDGHCVSLRASYRRSTHRVVPIRGRYQIHAENLAIDLAGRERVDNEARWAELAPPYQDLVANVGRALAAAGLGCAGRRSRMSRRRTRQVSSVRGRQVMSALASGHRMGVDRSSDWSEVTRNG